MAYSFHRKLMILPVLWTLATPGLPAAAEPPPRVDVYGHHAPVATFATERAPTAERRGKATADWQPLAPPGGEVGAVAQSPVAAGVALAATQAGVYRSVDAGANWSRVEPLGNQGTYDVEFAADGTAYAATALGLWRSTDGGLTWTELDLGLGFLPTVLVVTIDPSDANTVWIGLSDDLGGQPITVMRSTDGGANWAAASPPPTFSCYGIAINPNDSSEVFAVFAGFPGGGAVWFSNDGGTTWLDRTSGLPPNTMNDVAHDGSRVLVAGGHPFGSQVVGLYASSDDGLTWTPLHDGTWPTLFVNDVEIDPADPGTLLAATDAGGVHKSTDGGNSWQLSIGGSMGWSVLSARFEPGNPAAIWLGTSSLGVYRSLDAGATFEASTTGINLLDVNSLAANPDDAEELAAAFQGNNDGGVFTSTDGGATWSQEPLPATRYRTVRFTPGGILYAISDGPSSVAPEGLYRRNADGNWTGLGPDQGPLFESELQALRFSANDPDLILAGGTDFGVAGFEPTVWRSIDRGQSWTKAYEGFGLTSAVSDLEIVEDGTDQVALATHLSYGSGIGGVLRSIDGGATWLDSSTGLPVGAEGASLCVSASDAGTFYLADRALSTVGSGGLHRSTDGGQTWQSTGFAGTALDQVACDPALGNVVYVAPLFPQERVLRSEDHGATFARFDDGLEDAGAVRRLDVATGGPEPRLLMATHRGGFSTPLSEIGTCALDPTILCLPPDRRFQVSVTFETIQGGGNMGDGIPLPLSPVGLDRGGLFYFSDPQNPEILIKVLDGCAINGHYWVFYAATTNVGFELTVSDTATSTTRIYSNPDLNVAPATTDTLAFATCP